MIFDKVDPIAIYSEYIPLENNPNIVNYQLTVETDTNRIYDCIWAMISLRVNDNYFQEISVNFPKKGRRNPFFINEKCVELNNNEDQIICYLDAISNTDDYRSNTAGKLILDYNYTEFLKVQETLDRLYNMYILLK